MCGPRVGGNHGCMTLPSRDDVLTWIGLPVHDSAGAACGSCRNVFADQDSGLPEWVEVQLGSGDTVFAPTLGARLDDGVVRLAHSLDVVERSPRYTPDVDRTPEEEKALYEHYGVPWSDARSDTLLPAAVDGEQKAPRPQRLRRLEAPPTQEVPVPPPAPARPVAAAPAPVATSSSDGGGLPKAALVAGPAAAAAVAAALLRRRRQEEQAEHQRLGVAALAAPLALLAAVVAWRRRRVSGPDVLEVGVVPQMPAAVDQQRTQQTEAPHVTHVPHVTDATHLTDAPRQTDAPY